MSVGRWGEFNKACVFGLFCAPSSSEIRRLLSSGYRKGTSHTRVLGPVSGEKILVKVR